jgi:hypothetical protein
VLVRSYLFLHIFRGRNLRLLRWHRQRSSDDGLCFFKDGAQMVRSAEQRWPEVPNATLCAGIAASGILL